MQSLRSVLRIRLYANASYLILNSAVGIVLGVGFWALAARFYDEKEIGAAAGLLASMTLMILFAQAGLRIGIIRLLPDMRKDAVRLVNTCIMAAVGLALLFSLIFESSLSFWSPELAEVLRRPAVALSFPVLVAVFSALSLQNSVFVAYREARFVPATNAIVNVGKLGLVVPLVGLGAYGVFMASGVAATVALIITLVWFLPLVQKGYIFKPVFDLEIMRRLWRYSFQNHIVEILGAVPASLLPLLIIATLGTEANAYFYVSWLMTGGLLVSSMALANSLLAEGAHQEEMLPVHTRRALISALILTVPAATIMVIAAGPILGIFGGGYSAGATDVLRLLAVSAVPSTVNLLYFSFERVRKRMGYVLGAQVVAVGISLLLFYVLTPTMGVNGAALAWLCGQSVVAFAWAAPVLIRQVILRRTLAVPLPYELGVDHEYGG